MVDTTFGLWCAKGPDEPAETLASTLVERYDLEPPIDIVGLLQNCADVHFENWPFTECDALVYGLQQSGRPQVYVRENLPPRRQRLTLAHEYGHIKIGWHYGTIGCQAMPSEMAADSEENSGPSQRRGPKDQEREATRFAGYLLAPERFLRPLIRSTDMRLILEGLNRTGVSADAAFMRLRSLLQPGFIFTFRVGAERRVYATPGTVVPAGFHQLDIRGQQRIMVDGGQATVSERRVQWFRLTEFEAFEPVPGAPPATNLLRTAIASLDLDVATQQRMLLSISGVVGGSLSAERANSPQQALAILRHKFKSKDEYGKVTSHPTFDLYLRRKVEEWAARRGLI